MLRNVRETPQLRNGIYRSRDRLGEIFKLRISLCAPSVRMRP